MNSSNRQSFKQEFPNVLAIDFGTERIGLAVTRGSLAVPLKIISGSNQQQAITEIKSVCKQENVRRVVVGLSEEDMARQTQEFVNYLNQDLDIPVFYADETLTSQQARAKLQQAHKKAKHVDHYAAALILQRWLELNS